MAELVGDVRGRKLADDVFDGGGEMHALCRAFHWSSTPLGSSTSWPAALRTGVRIMLASPVATSLWIGPDYTLIYNDAYRRILGVKHDSALGRSGAEVWAELWPRVGPQFEQVRAGGDSVFADEALLTMERLEGGASEDAWFTYSLSALCDEAGSFLAVYNVAIEVTGHVLARREIERLLAESESARMLLNAEVSRGQQFAATLEQATDFIGIATSDGRTRYVNPAGRRLMGLASEDAVHQTMVVDFFTDEWRAIVEQTLLPILAREGRWRGEVVFRHFVTGEEIPAEWNAFAVHDTVTGDISAFACVARDLRVEHAANAERARLLREALVARQEAELASRAKSDFLAVMSHELRTPLNAIGGYAELLEMGVRGPVTPQQVADLRRIQVSQRHLLGLINQVLNHARLETGSVHFDVEDVSVLDAFLVAEGLVAPQARAKGITLAVEQCDPACTVRADAEKLRQILLNLLSNAVKFTPPDGRVRLDLEEHRDEGLAIIRVHDTGIGIPEDKFEMVFEPFVQVDSRFTRAAEGAGLGLSISRDLARGMGGELTVESTVGHGSIFTLLLPLV